jgi:replicative DNA helicase
VVAIAQFNRAAAKHDTPTAEDVGESYKIAQDADVFMTLRQRTEAEMEKDKLTPGKNFGNAILNMDKNRGGIDKVICPLIFNKENLRFREVLQ